MDAWNFAAGRPTENRSYLEVDGNRVWMNGTKDGMIISPADTDMHLTLLHKENNIAIHLTDETTDEQVDSVVYDEEEFAAQTYEVMRGIGDLVPPEEWQERTLVEDVTAKVQTNMTADIAPGERLEPEEAKEKAHAAMDGGIQNVTAEEAIESDANTFRDKDTGEYIHLQDDGYAVISDEEEFWDTMRRRLHWFDMLYRVMNPDADPMFNRR